MSDATTPDNLRAAGQDALRTRSDLKGVLLLALMIGACIVLIDVHVLLHTGEHLPVAIRDASVHLARFDYVGGRENAYSVGIEVTIWSLVGIHCRLAHVLCHEATHGGIDFSQMLLLWFSTALFGWGTTSVLIGLLRCLSLGIGDVTLGLHRIDAVLTVAFVCGFYNEETRRLLAAVRGLARGRAASDRP
jgi:hypothetical protein